MGIMEKQKTKFGWIEEMPNGKVFGTSIVKEMSFSREIETLTEYIDLGYTPSNNEYKLTGGDINTIEYVYINEDGERMSEDMPYVRHGIIVMKTTLKKHVSTEDK
tara:strand:+ start:618 stop:932 length:315 start_codon:yes stop_codon:yes gene_type:complete